MAPTGAVFGRRRACGARLAVGKQVEHQHGDRCGQHDGQAIAPKHGDDVGVRVAGEVQLDRQKYCAEGAEQEVRAAGHQRETVEKQQEHQRNHQQRSAAEQTVEQRDLQADDQSLGEELAHQVGSQARHQAEQ
ncbi:hypothetical protein D3C76_731980 [compost metagenome]